MVARFPFPQTLVFTVTYICMFLFLFLLTCSRNTEGFNIHFFGIGSKSDKAATRAFSTDEKAIIEKYKTLADHTDNMHQKSPLCIAVTANKKKEIEC